MAEIPLAGERNSYATTGLSPRPARPPLRFPREAPGWNFPGQADLSLTRVENAKETAGGGVALTGYTQPEDDGFNAHCPELGVATCGDTVEEVLDGLQDALEVYIAGLGEIGELERVFAERDVAIQSSPAADKVTVSASLGTAIRVYILPVSVSAAV